MLQDYVQVHGTVSLQLKFYSRSSALSKIPQLFPWVPEVTGLKFLEIPDHVSNYSVLYFRHLEIKSFKWFRSYHCRGTYDFRVIHCRNMGYAMHPIRKNKLQIVRTQYVNCVSLWKVWHSNQVTRNTKMTMYIWECHSPLKRQL